MGSYAKINKNKGFTFIEIIISMAIIVTIASMALPLSELTTKRQKEKELRIALETIRNAIDRYHHAAKNNKITHPSNNLSFYPPSLEILVEGVDDAKSLGNKKIYFLRRVPRNPFYVGNLSQVTAAKTWNTRSYASPPDNPQSGSDVFDVYVSGDLTGLNGIAYNDW